jgi:hypothetical protein
MVQVYVLAQPENNVGKCGEVTVPHSNFGRRGCSIKGQGRHVTWIHKNCYPEMDTPVSTARL